MTSEHRLRQGRFGRVEQYPEKPTDRIYCFSLSQNPRKPVCIAFVIWSVPNCWHAVILHRKISLNAGGRLLKLLLLRYVQSEPAPAQYDPHDPNIRPPAQAKKSPPFLSSSVRTDKMATKFFTGNHVRKRYDALYLSSEALFLHYSGGVFTPISL